jgi:hypothetical protein
MANNGSFIKTRIRIALILNILVMLLGFIFAFRYIISPELTVYHLKAMGVSEWASIDPAFKPMLTVFKRVAGIGMSTASVAMGLILIFGFRKGESWSRWAFLIICLVHYLPLVANQIYLEAKTGTNSPVLTTLIGIVIALTAFFLSRGMNAQELKS